MDVILREIREFGESIIFLDQHPSLVSIPALGNSYCTIAMNLKHGNDVSALGRAMLLKDEDKESLGKLSVGEAIVKIQGGDQAVSRSISRISKFRRENNRRRPEETESR